MFTYDLYDAWRKIHPNAQEYSWNRPNGSQLFVFLLELDRKVGCRYPVPGML